MDGRDVESCVWLHNIKVGDRNNNHKSGHNRILTIMLEIRDKAEEVTILSFTIFFKELSTGIVTNQVIKNGTTQYHVEKKKSGRNVESCVWTTEQKNR